MSTSPMERAVSQRHHGGVHRQDQGRLDKRPRQDPAQKGPQPVAGPNHSHKHGDQEQPHEALYVGDQHVHAVV